MSIAEQLNRLQELELGIESNEQALARIMSQIEDNEAVTRLQAKLKVEQQQLEELERQQRSAEWEIESLTSKLTATEESLYSGRVKDAKELTNLQHEVDTLRTRRSHLEDNALEIMDQVEIATTSVTTSSNELKALESNWHNQRQQLSAAMEQAKAALSALNRQRQLLIAEIDAQAVEFYQGLKKQKGQAVAEVEQGICCGCRISLPANELQQARIGALVQCDSCGRILFLP